MDRRLLVSTLCILFLTTGLAAGTVAFTDGDEVEPQSELYLAPADSDNGEAYVDLDDDLSVEVDGLNEHAEAIIDDLVTVGYAGVPDRPQDAETVWVDHDAEEVTFYRMDTHEPVDDEESAFTLESGENVTLGMAVDAGASGVLLETVTIRADVPSPPSGGEPEWEAETAITATEVDPGKTVTVTVEVHNVGDARGVFEPALAIDGEVVADDSLSTAVDQERSTTFELTVDEPGEYAVTVSDPDMSTHDVATLEVGDIGEERDENAADADATDEETPAETEEADDEPAAQAAVAGEEADPGLLTDENWSILAMLLLLVAAALAVAYRVSES